MHGWKYLFMRRMMICDNLLACRTTCEHVCTLHSIRSQEDQEVVMLLTIVAAQTLPRACPALACVPLCRAVM